MSDDPYADVRAAIDRMQAASNAMLENLSETTLAEFQAARVAARDAFKRVCTSSLERAMARRFDK